MSLIRTLVLAGAVSTATAGMAQQSDFDDRWYVGFGPGVVLPDNERGTQDSFDSYLSLNVGRFFTPSFSLDLRLDRYKLEFTELTPGPSESFRLESYGLVGRYHFRDGDTRPYVMLATGIQDHNSVFNNGRDVYGSIGVGMFQRYNDRFSARFELEGRYDNDRATFNRSSGFMDVIATVGFNFNIGSLPAAPEPVTAPPPAPAPPPPPPPAPEPEPEPEVIFEFDAMVTFDFDSARLRPAAIAELNEAVALLNLHDELKLVEVAGHTCDLGPAAHNQGLSERRAQAVRDFLVENGVSADRLRVRGYGEDQPKVPNTSDSNRQQNRRVELVVIERNN